jgi:membrane-associated phospholipid phosphatase
MGEVAAAAVVGALRVSSGEHFPSDVSVGALAGVAAGWGVPALHRFAPRLQLSASPTGVGLSGTF